MSRLVRLLTVALVGTCCVTSTAAAHASRATTVSPAFIAKTDRLCISIDAGFTRVLGKTFPYQHFDPLNPDARTLPLVGRYFAKALPVRRAIPGQLRRLGEPAAGKQAWDAIRSLALRDNAVAITQVSDALASNATAFVATVRQLQQLHASIGAKAHAAGFPGNSACGRIF